MATSPRPNPRAAAAKTSADAGRLALRRLPAQARGMATFERLMETAAQLLQEVGIQGLNTNLIAARSGVNISSIYKYFPNKQAILVALFERHNEQRFAIARQSVDQLDRVGDWRRQMDQALEQVMRARHSAPGNQTLRRAMRSSPELAEIDRLANVVVAQWLGSRLQALTGLPAARAQRVARIVIEAETALLDWWESTEVEHSPAVAREIKAMVRAYIETLMPAPAKPAKPARRG